MSIWIAATLLVIALLGYAVLFHRQRRTEPPPTPTTLEAASQRALDLLREQSDWDPLGVSGDMEEFIALTHHNLGRWMRNSWGLWSGASKLHADIHRRFGLTHPDDMSGLVLCGVWHLHKGTDPSADWQELTRKFQAHWAAMESQT